MADLAERGLVVLLIAVCLYTIGRGARNLPGDRRAGLLALLAPWIFMVCRDLYLDSRPHLDGLVYPFIVAAIWVLRPKLERLSLLGHLIGLTALASVLMGALTPAKGVFASYSGDLIAPEKQILPWGVLVGPFTDGNNLGQFLTLGLPVIALVPHRAMRVFYCGITVFAIVWTSSRSSIGAVVVGAALALALGRTLPANRRHLSGLVLGVLSVLLVAVPLRSGADDSFNNRGYIWKVSLRAWREHALLGNGSGWYSDIAKYANALGGNAFHGHNQFIHTLAVGGLIYLALMAAMLGVLFHGAGDWGARGVNFAALYLAMFLISCTLEVSFGVVDRGFLIAVTVLPMAFIALSERSSSPVPRLTP